MRAALLWSQCQATGTKPADEVGPDRDINYKFSYNAICYEAYLTELEKKQKRNRKK